MIRNVDLDCAQNLLGDVPADILSSVSGFYEWFLERAEGGEIKKIVIDLLPEKELKRRPRSETQLDVLVVYERFPEELKFVEDETDLRCRLLDILHAVILREAAQRKWDVAPFERAHELARPHVISQQVRALGPKWNRSRKFNAEVVLEWTATAAKIHMVVCAKDGGEVLRELVAETIPSPLKFSNILGSLTWRDDRTAVLRARDKSKEWAVSLEETL